MKRKKQGAGDAIGRLLTNGIYTIDEDRRAVRKGEKWLPLTECEYAILKVLNNGATRSRHELLTAIGGMNYAPSTRTIDQHIMRLRKKLGKRAIKTIQGMGYFIGNN